MIPIQRPPGTWPYFIDILGEKNSAEYILPVRPDLLNGRLISSAATLFDTQIKNSTYTKFENNTTLTDLSPIISNNTRVIHSLVFPLILLGEPFRENKLASWPEI